MIIKVLYSCKGCGLVKRECMAPARDYSDTPEGVVAYVRTIMECVGADHARQSPRCSSRVCDLMIPACEVHGVGCDKHCKN